MAGNYFHDPRPFYGLNHHNLISMDELFYGRREPPPWYMHQMPQVRSEPPRRPEQYIQREEQFREYRRPDMRDEIYMDHQYSMQQGANNGQQHGQQQKNQNQGNNNNNNNKGKHQQKHGNDNDEDDNYKGGHQGNHNHNNNNNGNKSNPNHGNKSNPNHGNNKSHNNEHGSHWSDNKGFHGGRGHGRHRRSLSLTQTVLKKLGLRDDTSGSDSSDDDRSLRKSTKKGGHGHVQQMKADHKPYTVRFDDQFYGHGHGYSDQSNPKKGGGGSEKFGEDHGSHGNKKGGGQSQGGILKTSKHKNGHDGYSSDEESHKNHGHGKGGNQHHGGAESGARKNNGQAATKQLGRSQSMDFRVNLCCENCERKVKKSLRKMDVDHVLCDQWNNRVVVVGNAKPESVLKKLRAVKKDTNLWHPQQHK